MDFCHACSQYGSQVFSFSYTYFTLEFGTNAFIFMGQITMTLCNIAFKICLFVIGKGFNLDFYFCKLYLWWVKFITKIEPVTVNLYWCVTYKYRGTRQLESAALNSVKFSSSVCPHVLNSDRKYERMECLNTRLSTYLASNGTKSNSSRGAAAQSVAVKPTGWRFDPHSRRWNLYFHFFALVSR